MVTRRKKLSLGEIEELKEGGDSALKLNRPDLATHLYLTIINSRNISREETQEILVDAYWKLYLLYRDKDKDYAMFVLGLLVENIDVPNGSRNNIGDIDHRTRIVYGSLRILIDHFAGSDPKMELKYARYFLLKFPLQIEAYRKLVRAHLRDGNEKEARKVISSLERRVMGERYVEYMDGLARIYIDEFGDFVNARRISDNALESDKQKTREFWLLRARIMRRYSGLATSMECIDNALKEDATYADALKMKGDMLFEMGRVMGARDAYRAAFEIDPSNFEVRDILSKLERDINERLEYERMMYSGVDIDRLIRDGFQVSSEMIPNPFLAEQKTPVQDPGWDQPQDSTIMEFPIDATPSDRPSVLIDLYDLLVSRRFQQAIDLIDTELKDHPGDTRLNLLKGTVLMMKGQYKSAQRIDDMFWQSPPDTLRDEMLQRDFNGIFVNIDEEIDFHNQRKHQMSGGAAQRRFGFSDLAPLQMSEYMLRGLMDFARSPTENGFLTHLKPRILEEIADDKVQTRDE